MVEQNIYDYRPKNRQRQRNMAMERGGLAPLYGLSRTESPSQPKSPQHQLQSSDLSYSLGAN
jgi:hypothetical protein